MVIVKDVILFLKEHWSWVLANPFILILLFVILWVLTIRLVFKTQEIMRRNKEKRKKLIRNSIDAVRGISLPYLSKELTKRIRAVEDEYEIKLQNSDIACPKEGVAQCFGFPYYKYKQESLKYKLTLDHVRIVHAIESSLEQMFHELREMVLENGYHGKSEEDLESWSDDKSKNLFTNSVDRIARGIGQDNHFNDTTNKRYTQKNAKDQLKKLVRDIIKLDSEEQKELKNILKLLIWSRDTLLQD